MSEPSNNPFEDANASHPLDLLINAISGSGEYEIPNEARDGHGEFNLEQLLSNNTDEHQNKRKRSRSPTSERDGKVAKIVKAHIIQASTERSKPLLTKPYRIHDNSTFSSIEVWHPTAGQKSYGKERRMLNPPPILRVSGPLLPLLTQATLQTIISEPDSARPDGTLSSQSQRIPLSRLASPTPIPQPGLTQKRAEKEENQRILREQASRHGFGQTLRYERNRPVNKERKALSDGLTFPGLWVADSIGKDKEFRLELSLGMPGVETADQPTFEALSGTSVQAPAEINAPVEDPGPNIKTSDDEPSNDLFAQHQTLDQASNDIIEQLTEEDRRMLDGEPQLEPTTVSDAKGEAADALGTVPGTLSAPAPPSRWATFLSAPLSVVSKPSQKTAKARSMNSCFGLDDSFALWVRIHSQTVRTKYMKLDDGQSLCLTARTNQWTPFKFEVTESASLMSDRPTYRDRDRRSRVNDILTYGSIGHLVDRQSGVRTEPMRLVKIDKGENVVGTDHGHPVSDLQRVGFVRLQNGQDDYTGGSRWYLSAPGARLGGVELTRGTTASEQPMTASEVDPQTLDGAAEAGGNAEVKPTGKGKAKPKKKPKTKRFALAEVVIAEDQGGAQFALNWTKADRYEGERARGFGKDLVKKLETCEKVEDWMCWILGGVDNFTYSFFDAQEVGNSFQKPIDPVVRHLSPPVFNAETNTLILTLNEEFFHTGNDPASDCKIYLGPIGPINTFLYRSVAPEKAGADNGHSTHFEAEPYDIHNRDHSQPHQHIRSDYPGYKPHILVAINMPPAERIIRAMQECFAEAQYQPSSSLQTTDEGTTGAEGWLTANDGVANARGDGEPASLSSAPHADEGDLNLSLDPALDEPSNTQHHDVDDITAALAAHAADPAFSLSQMDHTFLPSDLDPALEQAETEDPQAGPSSGTIQPQAEVAHTVPDLQFSRPEQDVKQVEMVPLPVVIVRTVDGVGFTVGRNVVAERVDSRGPGEKPKWGMSATNPWHKADHQVYESFQLSYRFKTLYLDST